MRKKIVAAILFIGYMVIFAGTSVALEFSADMVMTAEGHKIIGKMFATRDHSPTENQFRSF